MSGVISNGRRIEYPFRIAGPSIVAGHAGAQCAFDIMLWNYGALWVRIPMPRFNDGFHLLQLKVENAAGAEEVTYSAGGAPTPPPGEREGDTDYIPLLTIPPHDNTSLYVRCTPWAPGEYRFRIEFENPMATRRFRRIIGGIPSWRLEPIPDVWVGKEVFVGSFTVGEDAAEEIRQSLEPLRLVALDTGKPLRERSAVLIALVEMRHIYATEALQVIEKETRKDPAFHPHAVKALYDIALHGTGYRALPVLAALALDRTLPLPERLLCADVLATFASQKDLRYKDRIIHVVSYQERGTATGALQKLKADGAQEPPEMRKLLDSAKTE
jgi:hypothetical protein